MSYKILLLKKETQKFNRGNFEMPTPDYSYQHEELSLCSEPSPASYEYNLAKKEKKKYPRKVRHKKTSIKIFFNINSKNGHF